MTDQLAVRSRPNGSPVMASVCTAHTHCPSSPSSSCLPEPTYYAANHLQRVFEMFTRIDRSGVDVQPGLGIGLALARRLAEMHGGTLTAYSSGEGRGATFTLSLPTLPVTEQAAERVKDSNGAAQDIASLKVFVIEDNQDVSDTMSELLQDLGHEVWVAGDGTTGVSMVREVRPDVVLCDLGLPEVDGVEVCRRVRTLPSDGQPVMVALTGWGRDEDRRNTKLAGFDHHLVKPVVADELRRVLESVAC